MAPSKSSSTKPKIDSTFGLPDENPFASSSSAPKRAPPAARRQNIVKSGNSQASKPPPPPLLPGQAPPLFPVGYKTPLSLLSERCTKSGWEKANVDPKKLPNGRWTASVTLKRKNAKTGALDSVYMRPPPSPSPIAVEKDSAMEAKHWSAVHALFRCFNNLRLNLQLPPQTRDYWAALEAEKAASPPNKAWLWSTTPFETAAAAPPPPSAVPPPSKAGPTSTTKPEIISPFAPQPKTVPSSALSSRSATPSSSSQSKGAAGPNLSKWWLEAPEVRMPAALRDLVEETIRSLLPRYPTVSLEAADDYSQAPTPLSPEQTRVIDELLSMGFRRGHVLSAQSFVLSHGTDGQPFRVAMLSHLHLHVPEEDLPSELRSSKPADATARIATSKDSEALGKLWKAEKLAKETGVPVEVVERVLAEEEVDGDEGKGVDLLVGRLVGVEEDEEGEMKARWTLAAQGGGEDREGLDERRSDELMGLEGMFGDRFRRTDTGVEVLVSSLKPRRNGGASDQVVLRILLHSTSLYPSPPSPTPHPPTFYIYSSTLPPYLRLHLTALLARKLTTDESWRDLLEAGYGGVVGEMASWLMETYATEVDNPPDAREVLANLTGSRIVTPIATPSSRASPIPTKTRNAPTRRKGTPAEHLALQQLAEVVQTKPGWPAMLATRQRLPAWGMRERIVDLVKNNRVVIVSGETGSGKTTQVPSFILDDLIARGMGADINMLVTQPRRISAIGVATRVAAERMEDINDVSSRKLVGYAIRGERKAARDCRLLFCTTGVVLSRMNRGGDPDLRGVSHIFIDEVHERSVDSDFLLLELRDILARNPHLKVILMSATLNQAQFSSYFGGAPCIEIPGFTHPVQDHYAEDILPHLLTDHNFQPSSKPPAKKANQAQLDRMRSSFMERGVNNERTLMALENLTRSEKIDFGLVGATAAYCLNRSRDIGGDVLVFMTGVFEIKQAVDAIRQAVSGLSIPVEVFPLHANLTSAEQTSVFRPVKAGHRKVVVATNVAETSITIDGIVYVIDCGRVKENQFDPETSVTKLVECWTSRASARQRRGRAGRTRPGECFKLFTHYTEDNYMAPHPTPEIMRIPLEALCLQIKSMRSDEDVKLFLGKAIDPPDVRAIDSAWATLRLLGAIEEHGGTKAKLTPLGMHLAMIPVDLRLAKMLVLAAIFRCLDPILTVVALLSSKPFFLNPMEKREESKKARSMYYTSRSDLLSDVKAFDACLAAREGGHSALRNFAEDNFISLSTFRDVLQLRSEYLTALSDVGFIPFRAPSTLPSLNENASNENLLKAIVFAGTGRLVKVKLPPALFDKSMSGTIERDRESKEVKFFEKDGRVFLHPGSLMFTETRFATPFVTYFSKHVTTKPFLRDATEVPLYGVLLFGGKVNIELDKGLTVGHDNWCMMRAWPRIGVLVNSLRRLFDADLEANIEAPDFNGTASPVVQAMLALLEKDGGLY